MNNFSWASSCSIWLACAPLDVADTWCGAASSYEAVVAEEDTCCSNPVAEGVLWGAWASTSCGVEEVEGVLDASRDMEEEGGGLD